MFYNWQHDNVILLDSVYYFIPYSNGDRAYDSAEKQKIDDFKVLIIIQFLSQ